MAERLALSGQTMTTLAPTRAATGAPAFSLIVIGLTAFLTVVDLFATQALLPSLAAHYGVTPAAMGVAVNAATLGMAVSGVATALLSGRLDRRYAIMFCLVALAIPTLLLANAQDLTTFALLRVAQGVLMAAAFTLTLAHLGERCTAAASAGAFAAYVTGNVASNLVGRLISANLADHYGLATNFQVFAALNVAGGVLVFLTIRNAPVLPRGATMALSPLATLARHLSNPTLQKAFLIGFTILFAFIGTFTYVNFVLVGAAFALPMMALGFVYFVFAPSILSTPLAGRIAARIGQPNAIALGFAIALAGLPLLLTPNLAAVLAGMVLVACGTFAAQGVATGYVSKAATADRGAASGLYLGAYFFGGLAGSYICGQLFDAFGWAACVAGIAAALLLGLALALRLTPNT